MEFAAGDLEVALCLVRDGALLREDLGQQAETADGGLQRVLDLVRKGSGELPRDVEALRLYQGGAGLALLGDVVDHADGEPRRAARIAYH